MEVGDGASILIVKLSAIGDCVMATPVAEALRRALPGARICWAVSEVCQDVVRGSPYLDDVLVLEDRSRSPLQAYARLRRQIRAADIDAVVDLQGIFKSSVLVAASRAPVRIVGSRSRGSCRWCATHIVDETDLVDCHPTDYYLRRASALTELCPPWQYSLPVTAGHERAVEHLLQERGVDAASSLLAINPGCTDPRRRWSSQNFAALGDALVESGCQVAITGSHADAGLAASVLGAMQRPAADLTGCTSILEVAALFRRCACVITGDTGPLHIAYAVGAPVVGLFGPIPACWRLPAETRAIGIEHNHDCRQLPHPRCHRLDHCPCLQAITVDEVLAAVRRLAAL